MSSSQPKPAARRPQEVTVGALLAVSGSVVAIITLISTMGRLYTVEMTDVLNDVMAGPGMEAFSPTIDQMRRIAKVLIMILAVLSVTSAVLGIYVLRRDRVARIVLTGIGTVVALVGVLAGVSGWVLSAYIAMSLTLLWTKPAREWFRPERPAGAASSGWPPAPPGPGGPPVDPERPVWPPQFPPAGQRQQPPPGGQQLPPAGQQPPAGQPPAGQQQPPPAGQQQPPPPGWRPPPKGWRPPPPKR